MGNYHRVIGIDLGTTYSVVATYNFDKSDVKVIPNRQNEPTTPSVVYLSPQGAVSVGKAAKEKLLKDPNGVIFEVKRLMGHQDAAGNKKKARAGGAEYDPEFLSALLLKELKACAEKVVGEPIHDAVITVPAYFKESQKNATREAAKIARLNPRYVMNEPTAAAVAYASEGGEVQTFIVYDFGGGTFDVSIVRVVNEKTVDVLGTGGDSHLGGGDIDNKIVDWVLGKMQQQFGKDFRSDERLKGKLRMRAEGVKINLCNENAPQEFFLEAPTQGIEEINYTLDPATFEQFCAPLIERTLKEVEVAMDSAAKAHGLTWDDVEAFIMVGGSSKIPMVNKALKERFKKPLKTDLNPDEIVAIGAARMALNYQPSLAPEIGDDAKLKIDTKASVPGQLESTHVKDVVSHTLGIGLKDDIFDPLIPKDHVIPHKVVRGGYSTAEDNQTRIWVPLYQGDNPKASLNTKLGEVVIDGLAPEPKGAHQFQITFGLDADGVFKGEMLHVKTGKVTDIKLDRGKDQLTEKKRIELAQMAEAGKVAPATSAPAGAMGGSAPPKNPIVALVEQAQGLLATLPPEKQRELLDILTRLTKAQASNDVQANATAVTELTLFMLHNQKK